MKIAWFTNIGKRSENQDCMYIPEEGAGKLFIVSDGMGGHQAGAVASRLATESVVEYMEQNRSNSVEEKLRVATAYANTRVIAAAKVKSAYNGMGTTLTGVYFDKNRFYTMNIGDSRVYLYTNDRLYQITHDHSYVAELVENGIISKEQARNHPKRNVLTRAIGIKDDETADLYKNTIHPDELVLLCSDGLYDGASDEEIFDALHNMPKETNNDLAAICDELERLARQGGSTDNVTMILIKYEEGDAV